MKASEELKERFEAASAKVKELSNDDHLSTAEGLLLILMHGQVEIMQAIERIEGILAERPR